MHRLLWLSLISEASAGWHDATSRVLFKIGSLPITPFFFSQSHRFCISAGVFFAADATCAAHASLPSPPNIPSAKVCAGTVRDLPLFIGGLFIGLQGRRQYLPGE